MDTTEPLDLDALIEDADDYATALDYAGRSEGVRLIRGLVDEVRRLREVETSKGQQVNWQYGVRRKGSHVVGYEFTREGAISLCAEMNDGREPVRRSREGEWEAFA